LPSSGVTYDFLLLDKAELSGLGLLLAAILGVIVTFFFILTLMGD
jgi:hypothetical protein